MAHRPLFGSTTLVCLVIANMIGAGVYTTSGFTLAAFQGRTDLVIQAWMVAGLIALAGAYSYGKLIQVMPESGGEYLFLARAAHPLLGFVAGWVSMIAGFTGAIAFAATAMESYLAPDTSALPADSLAILAILLAGLAHGFQPRWGARIQNSFVVLKILLLLAFVGVGLTHLSREVDIIVATDVLISPTVTFAEFAGALVWISLSYAGFNAAVYVAEETHQPRKRVGRALLIGTGITTGLYVALNMIFVQSTASVSGQPDVAAIAAEAIGGSRLATGVRGIIALSLFTSVTSMMLAAPRVYAKMADDGFLPRFLQRGDGHPRIAVLAQCLLAIIFVLLSNLRDLLGYLGLTLSLCSALSVSCLLLPKIRASLASKRALILPVFYVLATTTTAVFMAINNPHQLTATTATFGLGTAVYFVTQKRSRSQSR